MASYISFSENPNSEDEDEEVFYNIPSVQSAPFADNNPAQKPTFWPKPPRERMEDQKRTALLRATLIARRQNTPTRVPAARVATPSQSTSSGPSPPPMASTKPVPMKDEPTSDHDPLGLDSLLAEGRAAAEAKNTDDAARTILQVNGHSKPIAEPATSKTSPRISPLAEPVQQQPHQPHPYPQQQQHTDQQSPTVQVTNQPVLTKQSDLKKLTDPYYTDLAVWLDMTGYHDVEFRTSKLSSYKERKALEEEAVRIQRRLEKLRQDEEATIQFLRASTAYPVSVVKVAPPPLPTMLPTTDAATNHTFPTPSTNGIKRHHSPEPTAASKAVRHKKVYDYRIRGVNDSSEQQKHPGAARTLINPLGLQHRISYPEPRGNRVDGFNNQPLSRDASRDARASRDQSRDTSLERRQAFYRHDGNPLRYEYPRQRETFHGSTPRRRDSMGVSGDDNRQKYHPNHPQYPPSSQVGDHGGGQRYRGSAGLDLRNGGVRYFMIKSWNHENVELSQAEGLWATQEKNEALLREAFETSRHVLLLFSVNQSMAFQGYALMTSGPDPSLPLPRFTKKLNWATSPAFTVRWLATSPVHFRHVGHLKNTMNMDDKTGQPHAVLVGKDGQEISQDAGMGVAWCLDEAEVDKAVRPDFVEGPERRELGMQT